jgi:DNA-binding response OmpR family regulator
MNTKATILLVEDDENLGFVLKDYLEMLDYEVFLEKDGQKGLESFKLHQDKINLNILDVMLPVMDGFGLAEEIRKLNPKVPIVFLTAKSMKEDKIRGFKLGADDYITKPFSSEELSLRIEAILRRAKAGGAELPESTVFDLGKFLFDAENQLLKGLGEERRLTKREAEVLKMLCIYKNRLLRRDVALKAIWGEDDYFMGRSMDVYITKLRKYLKDDESITITNIHGTGFKLEVKEDKF